MEAGRLWQLTAHWRRAAAEQAGGYGLDVCRWLTRNIWLLRWALHLWAGDAVSKAMPQACQQHE